MCVMNGLFCYVVGFIHTLVGRERGRQKKLVLGLVPKVIGCDYFTYLPPAQSIATIIDLLHIFVAPSSRGALLPMPW